MSRKSIPLGLRFYIRFKYVQRGFLLLVRRRLSIQLDRRLRLSIKVRPGLAPSIRQRAELLEAAGPVPRKIWVYWDTGFQNAPEVCQICLNSWRQKNPNWEIIEVTDANVNSFVNLAPDIVARKRSGEISVQHFADCLRLELLASHGGVWADASVFCVRHLDTWLPTMACIGFFAFHKPDSDREISNWFIASCESNRLTRAWADALSSHLSANGPAYHYYITHLLFSWIIRNSAHLRSMWQAVPKFPADHTHWMQLRYADPSYSTLLEQMLQEERIPVFKLDQKKFRNLRVRDTPLGRLLSREDLT